MIEEGRFEHLKGRNFIFGKDSPPLREKNKQILIEYQQGLIDYATQYRLPIEEASLPYVLAYRLHTLRESYQGIADSLGMARESLRYVYGYYKIQSVFRGERTLEVLQRPGMRERLSNKAKEQARRPEEIMSRSERGRKEMRSRWEDPTSVKRSFAASRYFNLLNAQGIVDPMRIMLNVAEDMRKRGLALPGEVLTTLDRFRPDKEIRNEILDCGTFTYKPFQRQLEVTEGKGVKFREPQAIVFELLVRKFGDIVSRDIFFHALGAKDVERGTSQMRTIVNRLRRDLSVVNLDKWVHTIKGEGLLLQDPQFLNPA